MDTLQGGPLPVINGVTWGPYKCAKIHGFAWGYNAYKWSYVALLITP